MKLKHAFTTLILAIVLVSCKSQTHQMDNVEGYPIEDISTDQSFSNNDDSGYPIEYKSSEQEQAEYYVSEIVIPSPEGNLAVVHGTLLTLGDNLPYLAPSLYLGQILKPDDEPESTLILSAISIEEDPIAVQAVDGKFVFIQIPPGEYGLFIWTPMSLFLIEDVETGQPILVDVKPGEILDLGTIHVP